MWHMAGYYDESDDFERGYAVAGFLGHRMIACISISLGETGFSDKYELEYFKASELSSGKGQFAKFRDNHKRRPRR